MKVSQLRKLTKEQLIEYKDDLLRQLDEIEVIEEFDEYEAMEYEDYLEDELEKVYNII